MLVTSRTRLILMLPALMLALGLGAYRYHANLNGLRADIEQTFQARHELTQNYLTLLSAQVDAMQQLLLQRYRDNPPVLPALRALRPLAGGQRWALSGREDEQGASELSGSVTGLGPLPLNNNTHRELNAALGLDALFAPILKHNPQISWVYYTSASDFMYLAPKPSLDEFHFERAFLLKPFWQDALAEHNPQRRQIISSLYEDAGGKDLMITLSAPIYEQNRMLGVVSLDLGIELLRRLTSSGVTHGETLLVDEHGKIVVRQGAFSLHEQYALPPSAQASWDSSAGVHWLGKPMLGGQLWLLHHISESQLYWLAARQSSATWLLIGLALLLYGVAWRLFFALRRVTRLMQTDPLTNTLNRRGFYDKAASILALNARQQGHVALLLMDIDHFKVVNDTFGHAVGDQVLRQAAQYMLKSARPFDLICRWGGEEFVVLMLLDDASSAANVAERMRQEAQRARFAERQQVTLSGGLVLLKTDESLDQAIRRADQLLYQAKENGRNRIEHQLPAAEAAG
ncbi:sensor domain-containing diguanylate cyclase [Pseudomonas sp. HAR-UPW-AIA-41]|uniref:sensor domain-containing diguanylate cyclase n=1 Tax=Pseudomonas sp. HAR-UPW-AIA-41 TaxID=1985301 RepID=UPI000BB3ABE9|nr:sensor domain-containing diguanylate cyclase [Pseudomonas sp. HAR-UPW-AIA-41]PAV48199.1 sensor domain-containing diguanylate cyclase [Pseudomonas sp. HAR-UPW-AIA-41]